MNKTINWGIIGCGDVTEVKSGPAFQKVTGFELMAVMRRNKAKLIDYAKRHHIEKYYTDADQLINDEEIDAVYIATPPDSHKEYALKVAQARKICCIEKPLAPSYADSLAITEAFKAQKVPLFVAYYRRSLPRFMQIKRWITAGDIGEIRHISWFYSCPPKEIDLNDEYNWRTDGNIAKAGYFDDLACHGLDLFIYLLGDIDQATGFSTNQLSLYSAKDAVSAAWIHKSGITGSGSWNFGTHHFEDQVQIIGSKGKIEFSVFKDESIFLDALDKKEQLFVEHPENIQFFHVENIKKHLFHNSYTHPSTGDTATHVAWVMDEILNNSSYTK